MQTKPLLYGLIGFFIGGLLVSVAATTFDKPQATSEMSMSEMVSDLESKTGDAYDEAFINAMIAHHQSAVDMAKLSSARANHTEIKKLSEDITVAQRREIDTMHMWQREWDYEFTDAHSSMSH